MSIFTLVFANCDSACVPAFSTPLIVLVLILFVRFDVFPVIEDSEPIKVSVALADVPVIFSLNIYSLFYVILLLSSSFL